jgi:hypothetical protein
MRSSRIEVEDEAKRIGYEHGYEWARDDADHEEMMEHIERARIQRSEGRGWEYFSPLEGTEMRLEEYVGHTEQELDPAAYWEGWVEGVEEVWDRIREYVQ